MSKRIIGKKQLSDLARKKATGAAASTDDLAEAIAGAETPAVARSSSAPNTGSTPAKIPFLHSQTAKTVVISREAPEPTQAKR